MSDHIFYRDRPEWKDVTPIPQEDGPNPVVQIAYSDKFKDIFDYFRAVLVSEEVSERALKLSEDAVLMNPSNYTVWNYRRHLLKKLEKDLNEELKFCSKLIDDHPKTYQTWHHRHVLVELLNDPSLEKAFTAEVLLDSEQDSKNYHAWQHRQWVVQAFGLWSGELEYAEELINEDCRNNSAWNHRFYVLSNTRDLTDDELIKKEMKFTMCYIEKTPNNESPWSYLRGLLQKKSLLAYPEVLSFADGLYSSGSRSPHLLAFIVDCIEEQLMNNDEKASLKRALQLCCDLTVKYDTIRKEYWKFIGRNLQALYGTKENLESFKELFSDLAL